MLEKQSQSPSFAVAEKPVRFLCPITVHTQLLESCFHESAHPHPAPLFRQLPLKMLWLRRREAVVFTNPLTPVSLSLSDFHGTHCIHSRPPFAEQRDMGAGDCTFNPREAQRHYARRCYRTARESWAGVSNASLRAARWPRQVKTVEEFCSCPKNLTDERRYGHASGQYP